MILYDFAINLGSSVASQLMPLWSFQFSPCAVAPGIVSTKNFWRVRSRWLLAKCLALERLKNDERCALQDFF